MAGKEKAQELLETLNTEVGKLVSGEDWKHLLTIQRKLYRYSFGNQLLIAIQRPGATMVAGYRAWQGMERQVRKGEKSIAILAPVVKKVEVENEDGSTREARRVVAFRAASVFDISQTDGPELPDAPVEIEGDAPAGMLAEIVRQIESYGYSFERGDTGSAGGWTDPRANVVRVSDKVSDAQAVKTAVHELAHILLTDPAEYNQHRGVFEVEAESVAFVVAGALGLETDEYSFGYVAGWSGGDMALVKKTGERVARASKQVLSGFEADRELVTA